MKRTEIYGQNMLKELWRYVRLHKKTYIIIALGLMINYALVILPTQTVQRLVNLIAKGDLTRAAISQAILTILAVAAGIYLVEYIWIKLLFSQSITYRFELRRDLFRKMIGMRTPYFEKFRSGDMLTRFTTDTSDYSELVGYGIMSIFTAVGTILFVLPAMLWLSWQVTLLASLPIVVVGYIVYHISTKQEIASEEARDAVAQLSNEVLEVVEGIRVTRAYGKQENGRARFRAKTTDLVKKSDRVMLFQAAYGRLAYAFMGLSTAIVIGVGGHAMQTGQLQLGDVVALQLYTLMLIDPMWVLSDIVLLYQIGHVAYGKIAELHKESDDLEADGQEELQAIDSLTLADYHFSYAQSDKEVLRGISLKLKRGQTLGIVGKTGSGKTTLVRQLLRQYPVGTGQFLINDQPIQTFKRSSIEVKLGYVPQEHVLFSRNVFDNIRLGHPTASQEEVMFAVEAAAFKEDLERMANGLDTMVGEKGVSISGGQKQRLSIARALIKEPELLILDDSLSAVDARTERQIISNIQKARAGKTTVIVTHRLSAINHADWVIVMDEGRITEAGRPADLLAQGGWYHDQYHLQELEEGGVADASD